MKASEAGRQRAPPSLRAPGFKGEGSEAIDQNSLQKMAAFVVRQTFAEALFIFPSRVPFLDLLYFFLRFCVSSNIFLFLFCCVPHLCMVCRSFCNSSVSPACAIWVFVAFSLPFNSIFVSYVSLLTCECPPFAPHSPLDDSPLQPGQKAGPPPCIAGGVAAPPPRRSRLPAASTMARWRPLRPALFPGTRDHYRVCKRVVQRASKWRLPEPRAATEKASGGSATNSHGFSRVFADANILLLMPLQPLS